MWNLWVLLTLGTSGCLGLSRVPMNSVVVALGAESCNAWSQRCLGEGEWPRQEVGCGGQGRLPL